GVIRVYPNPTQDYVSITGLEEGNYITLINLSGQTVLSKKATGTKEQMSLKSLPVGSYILSVIGNKVGLNTKIRIIKQ
ncbi:T9SS type A sorting domain-containing protein, partial [Emticicia sp. CRIBPO]|uniref:T9SS type A sorting domain-containing protein n=1 Tax=Emticicia sp. CRIBPO TaxID=2683258 RepID=UPI00141285E6